jgi:Holliday junction resolvase|tara:strand:+ start:3462 stop:3791 length:330 start_codon:yes stop_codon:yes gene_type:complete
MNTRQKGRIQEYKLANFLKSQGFFVYRVPGTMKFNKQVDIFGMFDILAMKDGFVRLIQVKSNRKPTTIQLRKLVAFKNEHCAENIQLEWHIYWNRGKRKNKFGWEAIVI